MPWHQWLGGSKDVRPVKIPFHQYPEVRFRNRWSEQTRPVGEPVDQVGLLLGFSGCTRLPISVCTGPMQPSVMFLSVSMMSLFHIFGFIGGSLSIYSTYLYPLHGHHHALLSLPSTIYTRYISRLVSVVLQQRWRHFPAIFELQAFIAFQMTT